MTASTRTEESLLNTFPGRLFVEHLRFFDRRDASIAEFVAAMPPDLLNILAGAANDRYLWSNDCAQAIHLDIDDPELREYADSAKAALAKLSAFNSPQIRHGKQVTLCEPRIRNRSPLSARPVGAFWTSTRLNDNKDTYSEAWQTGETRWEVHFDPTAVRLARIDSAHDWSTLIDGRAITASGCSYPDWPVIAASFDAIHLSALGLLLAHPSISDTPFVTTTGSGLEHSQAGHYASVAVWELVSTAWLHKPPNADIRPTGIFRST